MAFKVLRLVLPLLPLLGVVFHPYQNGLSFAMHRQESGAEIRERSGLALRRSAAADFGPMNLTRDDQHLVSIISTAGERREWDAVRSAFASYHGVAAPVYSAALHAAVRCREYREGADIYEQCRKRCDTIHGPVYTQALKIFGKLEEPAKVREVWAEAMGACELNIVLASARIGAAADEGDIEGAAAILDQVNTSGIPIDAGLVNSAIRACWGPGKYRDKAARYFYALFAKLGLTPDVVIFTTLGGAFSSSPLEEVVWTYKEMKALQIAPNRVFAETYLVSVLGGIPRGTNAEVFARVNLRRKPIERLQAARDALNDFESQGIELSGLCRMAGRALSKLGF